MAKVNRKELVAALDKVSPGIGSKENDIQATCFVFSDGEVFTYNDELLVSAALPKPINDLELAVQAKDFLSLLNKMTDEEIDIEGKDGVLLVKGRRAKAEIIIEKEIKMPIEEVEIPSKWHRLDVDFIMAVKSCLPFVSKDMSKPLSTCVHLKGDRVEVSDVDRAARYVLTTDAFKKSIYLPGVNARAMVRFKAVEYNITKGWIHFQCEDKTVLSCRTNYEGQEFADLTPLLDAQGVELELPERLQGALERSGIFTSSSDGTEVTMSDKYVSVHIENQWCTVSCEGSLGKYEERVRCDYTGEPIAFHTQAEVLMEALQKNQRCEVCDKFIKIFDEQFCQIVAVLRKKKSKKEPNEKFPSKSKNMDDVPF